jgi:hypothetical protein
VPFTASKIGSSVTNKGKTGWVEVCSLSDSS